MMEMRTSPASVVKVGGGRGFIVPTHVKIPAMKSPPCTINGITRPGRLIPAHSVERRLILTAAHCLPKMPPPLPSFFQERTYKDLWGALDGTSDASKNTLWAECLFADPIGDVAILGPPDGQGDEEYSAATDAYHALTDGASAIQVGKPQSGRGWLLALSGDRWIETTMTLCSTLWGPVLNVGPTEPGMSGSPILNAAGRAVGVVSQGCESVDDGGVRQNNDTVQPILTLALPGWFLKGL
jgi:hypothetical protein